MSETNTILVVDDDSDVRWMAERYLTKHGFEVESAPDGARMREIVAERSFDLIILDITMPGEDGLSLARFLREHHQPVAIVMLTASGEVVDRVVGLEIGADDYLAKPCDPRELLARVKSVLRRTGKARAVPETPGPGPNRVRFGLCELDLESRKLFGTDQEEIPITGMEFDLLKAFADNPNKVLTRDRLLDLSHNRDRDPFDRSIDIRITRIRKKIEPHPAKPQVIKTVRGAGYIFKAR
jgi:two-component system phosphate regulon response regulator OmpR